MDDRKLSDATEGDARDAREDGILKRLLATPPDHRRKVKADASPGRKRGKRIKEDDPSP